MTHYGEPEASDYSDSERDVCCACDGEFGDICESHCCWCRREGTLIESLPADKQPLARVLMYRQLFNCVEPDTGLRIVLCGDCKEDMAK